MNNKYLLLCNGLRNAPKVEGVVVYPIYRKCNIVMRTIRYVHHKTVFFQHLRSFWLDKWKNKLKDYSVIVVSDNLFDYTPFEYIRTIRPDVRLVCCFRNRVNRRINHSGILLQPDEIKSKFNCELWTYNQEDSRKYGMTKYNQFHLVPPLISGKKSPISFDVYFIGFDKNRIKKLIYLKRILDSQGCSSKIEVVANSQTRYNDDEKTLLVKPRPYKEVLDNVLRSRCIIDIVDKENYGMTYRCLEAVILKKKLITNYKDIIEIDFYNKHNIFVLGIDDESNLKNFIYSTYDDSNNAVMDHYSYQYFCKKIFMLN